MKHEWLIPIIKKYIDEDKIHGKIIINSDGTGAVYAEITLRVNKPAESNDKKIIEN